jgi:hypothetical protein
MATLPGAIRQGAPTPDQPAPLAQSFSQPLVTHAGVSGASGSDMSGDLLPPVYRTAD